MLVSKMYAWRGYSGTHNFNDDPNRITLTATDKGDTIEPLAKLFARVNLIAGLGMMDGRGRPFLA